MVRALLLGCGNIGAMYDFDSDRVATYAKAFHVDPEIEFCVFDTDAAVAARVASRYGVRALERWEAGAESGFDLVVVATPTATHHEYLSALLAARVKLIICEKPVDTFIPRMDDLVAQYRSGTSRVMVNYFRRFQPKVAVLRDRVAELQADGPCTTAVVTYQRGFHNNASHAVDLLGYLFNEPFEFEEVQLLQSDFDEFPADPTVSLSCAWRGMRVNFVGLPRSRFSHFEMQLFFPEAVIRLQDGGNEIEYLTPLPRTGTFHPRLRVEGRSTDVLKDYMVSVCNHAKFLLADPMATDNFLESVEVSRRILTISTPMLP